MRRARPEIPSKAPTVRTAYAASKASVASLPQSLAVELLADNILVNPVVPSILDTPANRASIPKADHASCPTPARTAQAIEVLENLLGRPSDLSAKLLQLDPTFEGLRNDVAFQKLLAKQEQS